MIFAPVAAVLLAIGLVMVEICDFSPFHYCSLGTRWKGSWTDCPASLSKLIVIGAKASAVIYSLVETAGANGLSERRYLHVVLSNLSSMDFHQHPELLKDRMPCSDYMRSCFE